MDSKNCCYLEEISKFTYLCNVVYSRSSSIVMRECAIVWSLYMIHIFLFFSFFHQVVLYLTCWCEPIKSLFVIGSYSKSISERHVSSYDHRSIIRLPGLWLKKLCQSPAVDKKTVGTSRAHAVRCFRSGILISIWTLRLCRYTNVKLYIKGDDKSKYV